MQKLHKALCNYFLSLVLDGVLENGRNGVGGVKLGSLAAAPDKTNRGP